MIKKIIAEIRNKLTPLNNLAVMVDDSKDLNAIKSILNAESKIGIKCTAEIKLLLQDILDLQDKKENSYSEHIENIKKTPFYSVKAVKTGWAFKAYDYQIIFDNRILFYNLSADNANALCDALNGAYLYGFNNSKDI
jgi:hypothetical protein